MPISSGSAWGFAFALILPIIGLYLAVKVSNTEHK